MGFVGMTEKNILARAKRASIVFKVENAHKNSLSFKKREGGEIFVENFDGVV